MPQYHTNSNTTQSSVESGTSGGMMVEIPPTSSRMQIDALPMSDESTNAVNMPQLQPNRDYAFLSSGRPIAGSKRAANSHAARTSNDARYVQSLVADTQLSTRRDLQYSMKDELDPILPHLVTFDSNGAAMDSSVASSGNYYVGLYNPAGLCTTSFNSSTKQDTPDDRMIVDD